MNGRHAWPRLTVALNSSGTNAASALTRKRTFPSEAMLGYLHWKCGLIAQLEREGTYGFKVL
ncbi:hypothetical protein DMX12_04095 [Pseudomonas sp. MB-090624]|nr:hypothetical protein DMX12_04095 [Pseudomonas sp. MB-090624]